ncbi:MAG: hypothetical protein ABSA46_13190 [Thermodesulfovibrionales bacterium]|jgi:hypothetical protein
METVKKAGELSGHFRSFSIFLVELCAVVLLLTKMLRQIKETNAAG